MVDFLSLNDLQFSYEKWGESKQVIDSFSGLFPMGELNIITGPNGSGKSTLAKLIVGKLEPSSGCIRLTDKSVADARQLRKVSFFVSQDLKSSLATNLTVKENLQLGGKVSKQHYQMLKSVGLDTLSNQAVYNLSGGQRQLLSVVIAAVIDKPIIIFDEPTASLDPDMSRKCVEVISQLKSKRQLLLVITHHRRLWKGLYNQNINL